MVRNLVLEKEFFTGAEVASILGTPAVLDKQSLAEVGRYFC